MSVPTDATTLDVRVDRLAAPLDDAAVQLVEERYAGAVHAAFSVTDSIEAHRAGLAYLFPPQNDHVGDHRPYALAPFVAPRSSRFSDGSFGVLYAGFSLDTAQEEALYWHAQFFRDAGFPDGAIATKLHLQFRTCGDVVDLRLRAAGIASLYDPDPANYAIPQRWGRAIYDADRAGLWYDSVRYRGGECVGIFLPRVMSEICYKSATSTYGMAQPLSPAKRLRRSKGRSPGNNSWSAAISDRRH